MKQIAVCILWMASFSLSAQSYWEEAIDTVSASGYYHIELSQEIAGLGLESLIIVDEKDQEVPYFVRSSVPVKEMRQMEMYTLLLNERKDSINTLIVHNDGGQVARFYVQMKEADATKHIAVRGSYDRQQWFGVKQRALLNTENTPSLGAIAVVDIPTGDYTYYELVITNNSLSPLNITGVGKMEKSSIYGQFVELPVGAVEVKEIENGNTVLTFPSMRYPYYVSKIEWSVTGKGHYNRKVGLEDKQYRISSFELSSREAPVFYFDPLLLSANESRIVIENQNNPPLTVRQVKLFGMSRYLCAYLDAGTKYCIRTGSERYRDYDIRTFASEIPTNLSIVQTSGLKELTYAGQVRSLRFFEKPVFLWGVLVLTGALLLYICVRLLKELKEKE